MPSRFVHINFTSPATALDRTMTVDDALALLAKHIPARELDDALSFLEIDRMAEGYYKGSIWSVTFRAVEPRDLADSRGDSTSTT